MPKCFFVRESFIKASALFSLVLLQCIVAPIALGQRASIPSKPSGPKPPCELVQDSDEALGGYCRNNSCKGRCDSKVGTRVDPDTNDDVSFIESCSCKENGCQYVPAEDASEEEEEGLDAECVTPPAGCTPSGFGTRSGEAMPSSVKGRCVLIDDNESALAKGESGCACNVKKTSAAVSRRSS